MLLHAHVSSTSQDCDGRYSSAHVVRPNEAEIAESRQEENDFSELNFTERVLGSVVSLTSLRDGQQARVDVTEFGFDWSRPTDEGYEATSVVWCRDEYCEDESWRRDHSAEAAGY